MVASADSAATNGAKPSDAAASILATKLKRKHDVSTAPAELTQLQHSHGERSGFGHIAFSAVHDGQQAITRVTHLEAMYPLKLMTVKTRTHHHLPHAAKSQQAADAAPTYGTPSLAYMLTYGGGVLARDKVNIHIECEPLTTAILTTQTSTKVYKQGTAHVSNVSTQHIDAHVDDHATLCLIPDAVSPYASSNWYQHQSFHLQLTSNLMLVDWYTAGRYDDSSRDERWMFDRFRTTNSIRIDNVLVLHDAVDLRNQPIKAMNEHAPSQSGYNIHALTVRERMMHYNVCCMLVLIGPRFHALALDLHRAINSDLIHHETNSGSIRQRRAAVATQHHNKPDLVVSSSILEANGRLQDIADRCYQRTNNSEHHKSIGVVIRFAAISTHLISARLKELLSSLRDELICAPWDR